MIRRISKQSFQCNKLTNNQGMPPWLSNQRTILVHAPRPCLVPVTILFRGGLGRSTQNRPGLFHAAGLLAGRRAEAPEEVAAHRP